jgi:hypothetical protein
MAKYISLIASRITVILRCSTFQMLNRHFCKSSVQDVRPEGKTNCTYICKKLVERFILEYDTVKSGRWEPALPRDMLPSTSE